MDIFKFNNPTEPTKMEQGEILNNIKRKLWIERYVKAGEFELVANISSGLKDKLPIGSYISHVNTKEIMTVENHEIVAEKGKEPQIKVTGRGFESIFEQRIIGLIGTVWPGLAKQIPHKILADLPWNQAVTLIRFYTVLPDLFTGAAGVFDEDDAIPFVSVLSDITGTGDAPERIFDRADLYSTIVNFLEGLGLGMKIVRPGQWSPLGESDPNLAILIHKGVDRSDEIIFSYDTGDIENAEYLWSNKNDKNAAYVVGTWIQAKYAPPETGPDRRWLLVDGRDIDSHYDVVPEEPERSVVAAELIQRGMDALSSQKKVELNKAEVSKEITKPGYRVDFDVGDIVTVSGDYNATAQRRISEYVEIEDENGRKSYPTLTAV